MSAFRVEVGMMTYLGCPIIFLTIGFKISEEEEEKEQQSTSLYRTLITLEL
jgi:hypothetical protein